MSRRQVIVAFVLLVVAGLAATWWRWAKPLNLAALAQHRGLIAELAETIIPRTDTPGAKDANVAAFILEMVQHGISRQEGHTFARGLDAVEDYCLAHFRRGFEACTLAEKTQTLAHFEGKGHWTNSALLAKVRNKLLGRAFFPLLRSLTVVGYCTSEVGAKQGLAYDYIPDKYQGCVSLANGQRAWATA